MFKWIMSFFGQKKETIARLQIIEKFTLPKVISELAKAEECIQLIRNNDYLLGVHLLSQPFIPEYLGFMEYINRDDDDIIIGRIYHMDDLNIVKPINKENWVIISKSLKINVTVSINNMLEAIHFFNMIGVEKISTKNYLIKSNLDSDKLKKQLNL